MGKGRSGLLLGMLPAVVVEDLEIFEKLNYDRRLPAAECKMLGVR